MQGASGVRGGEHLAEHVGERVAERVSPRPAQRQSGGHEPQRRRRDRVHQHAALSQRERPTVADGAPASSTASSSPSPRTSATPAIAAERARRAARRRVRAFVDEALALDRVEHGQRGGGDRRAAAERASRGRRAGSRRRPRRRPARRSAARPPRPLASVTASGRTPSRWKREPRAACGRRRSAPRRAPAARRARSHSARAAARNAGVSGQTPPSPCTGSSSTAAVCGPTAARSASTSFARDVHGSRPAPARRARAWRRCPAGGERRQRAAVERALEADDLVLLRRRRARGRGGARA